MTPYQRIRRFADGSFSLYSLEPRSHVYVFNHHSFAFLDTWKAASPYTALRMVIYFHFVLESKAESSLKECSLVDQVYDFSWHGGRRCSHDRKVFSSAIEQVESSFLNMNHTNHFSDFRTYSIASGTMVSLIVEVFVGGRCMVSFCYNSLTKR